MTMFLSNDIYVDLHAITEVVLLSDGARVTISANDGDDYTAEVSHQTGRNILAALKAERDEESKLRAVG